MFSCCTRPRLHRVQGTTVDTAHALITPEMTRESFYVTASRARHTTAFYTATHDLLSPDEDDRLDAVRNGSAQLRRARGPRERAGP